MTPQEIAKVAAEANVDPRSVARALAGRTRSRLVRNEIVRALRKFRFYKEATKLAGAVALMALVLACSSPASPIADDDAAGDSAPADASITDVVALPVDAGADAMDARRAPPADDCAPNAFTQLSCFGVLAPDAGTSHTTACAKHDGCELLEDDAGANPPVWCCP